MAQVAFKNIRQGQYINDVDERANGHLGERSSSDFVAATSRHQRAMAGAKKPIGVGLMPWTMSQARSWSGCLVP